MTVEATPERAMLLVSHTARAEAIEATIEVVEMLRQSGVTPVMTKECLADFAPYLSRSQTAELGTDFDLNEIEITFVLGGDGTILRAAEIVRDASCPIVGVNLGHVGFLAEMERYDLDLTVQHVLERKYTVEERVTLEVTATFEGDTIAETWAVNEASVEKRSRMLEVAIGVDGRPLSSFGCDGVVMSTPTGSTAYAFSAGGPVVWPSVQAMLLVPIAAHTLFNRPLVVSPDSVFTVEIDSRSESDAELWCDGRRHSRLPQGSVVEVRRSPEPVRLARIDEAVFTDRLVRKFDLPVSGWRGSRRPPE